MDLNFNEIYSADKPHSHINEYEVYESDSEIYSKEFQFKPGAENSLEYSSTIVGLGDLFVSAGQWLKEQEGKDIIVYHVAIKPPDDIEEYYTVTIYYMYYGQLIPPDDMGMG